MLAAEPALARLDVPTLIVWGTGDEFFELSWAYWLRDAHRRRARGRRDPGRQAVLARRAPGRPRPAPPPPLELGRRGGRARVARTDVRRTRPTAHGRTRSPGYGAARADRAHDVRHRPDDGRGRAGPGRRGARVSTRSTSPSTRTSRCTRRTRAADRRRHARRGVQAHARPARRAERRRRRSTDRILLGTGICVVAQREPIVTAKAIATLDATERRPLRVRHRLRLERGRDRAARRRRWPTGARSHASTSSRCGRSGATTSASSTAST